MKPPFSDRAARIKKGKAIVHAQHANEPGADAGARMQGENKRIHGQPPSREGGTPKTPTPPQPPEGARALLQSMAMKAHTAEPRGRKARATHQPESGNQNRALLMRPAGPGLSRAQIHRNNQGYYIGAHRHRGGFTSGSRRLWS